MDTAREPGIEGQEAGQFAEIGAVEHPAMRAAARPGAGNDARDAVAVDIAERRTVIIE